MSDYFDHVERSLREAVRRRRHLPWYARVTRARSRAGVVALVGLVGAGSALAASGVLRTGSPVVAEVAPNPSVGEGSVLPASVRTLALSVPDPRGGPPWGLRVLATSRGLLCVEPGRLVGGRVGAIGRDGAFRDDGAFHPFSTGYLIGVGCGTRDGRGDAFMNVEMHGIPASALEGDRRYTAGGCYSASPAPAACPPADRRDIYFGMLGPDATSIVHRLPGGGTHMSSTAGSFGAYLVVLPHAELRCSEQQDVCSAGNGYSFSPELEPNDAISAVNYRGSPACRLPKPGELERLPGERRPHCSAVGYVPPRSSNVPLTARELASPVTVTAVRAHRYCERGELTIACEGAVPAGFTRADTLHAPPQTLLVVRFVARHAVTDFDSHYEIETSPPSDPRRPGFQEACGGTFGPTQSNMQAGTRVQYTTFIPSACRGVIHLTVAYVVVDGPSGAAPVPGLPGQSSGVRVGQADLTLP